ncbi:MAG: hypothetical protein M3Z54_14670 [Gemmatimonadota bacterium]|nr:hypothetical protein [Gemmatimonadota bacterium]
MTDPIEAGLTILPRGDGIRWAIGTKHGLRGSTWRFWGNMKGDFYVAVRTLGGFFKTSLHRDGWCQTGVTKEYLEKSPHKSPRKLDRWQLPDAPRVMAVQIVTSAEELDLFDSEEKEPMVWLPAPQPGSISVVTIVVWHNGVPPGNDDQWPGQSFGTVPIGIIRTESRSAIAVRGQYPLTEETRDMIEAFRRRVRASAPPDFAPGPGLRTILIGQSDDGPRLLAELSLRS